MDADFCRHKLFNEVYHAIKHFWFWKASCFKTTGQEADWLHLLKSFAYCRYCLLLIKISHVSHMNFLYSIINLDSWWCPVLQYLSVLCLILVVRHCLLTNLTHHKGMFLTFLFNNLFQKIGFFGDRKKRALFRFKCQRVNNENKFSVSVQALISNQA